MIENEHWQIYVVWKPEKELKDYPYSTKLHTEKVAKQICEALNKIVAEDNDYYFRPTKVVFWQHMPRDE